MDSSITEIITTSSWEHEVTSTAVAIMFTYLERVFYEIGGRFHMHARQVNVERVEVSEMERNSRIDLLTENTPLTREAAEAAVDQLFNPALDQQDDLLAMRFTRLNIGETSVTGPQLSEEQKFTLAMLDCNLPLAIHLSKGDTNLIKNTLALGMRDTNYHKVELMCHNTSGIDTEGRFVQTTEQHVPWVPSEIQAVVNALTPAFDRAGLSNLVGFVKEVRESGSAGINHHVQAAKAAERFRSEDVIANTFKALMLTPEVGTGVNDPNIRRVVMAFGAAKVWTNYQLFVVKLHRIQNKAVRSQREREFFRAVYESVQLDEAHQADQNCVWCIAEHFISQQYGMPLRRFKTTLATARTYHWIKHKMPYILFTLPPASV